MRIVNKTQSLALLAEGKFGNKIPCWTLLQYRTSGYQGLVTIRTTDGGGGFCVYDLPREEAEHTIKTMATPTLRFNPSMPDDKLVIQGEYSEDPIPALRYSRVKKPMRKALQTKEHNRTGAGARLIVKDYMDANSYENLGNLLEQYPGHVVEFSTYSTPVGDLRWNTVFWEVRNY